MRCNIYFTFYFIEYKFQQDYTNNSNKKKQHAAATIILQLSPYYSPIAGGSIQNRTLSRREEDREPLYEQPWLKLSNPRPSYTLTPTHTRVSPTPLGGACTVQCAPMRARCSSPRRAPAALVVLRPTFRLSFPSRADSRAPHTLAHATHTRRHRRHRLFSDFRLLLRVRTRTM